jgi:hypothetical protein
MFPAMKQSVLVRLRATLAACLIPIASVNAEAPHVRACVSPGQARDILITQRLVAPFRAFGEAMRSGDGEVVGLQLCRLNEDFVYDVTLLRRDGRVVHFLVNARNGVPLAPANRASK